MDIDDPGTPKLTDMRSRGPYKHWCKVCTKNFSSGRALGGHMSCHRHAGMRLKSTPSPPAIVAVLPVSLLGPSDEKPSLPSLETQCLHCSKEFSTCQSMSGNMRMHSEKKVMAKLDKEPAGIMEASADANGDHGHNVMLFSPVKRKRSKRGMPALDSKEMCAAAALLMLAEYSDKTSAYDNSFGGDNDDNISTPNLLKETNLNAFDQLVQYDVTNNMRPKSDKNSDYEGFNELSEKPEANNSVEDLKSGDLSAAVNINRHQCKVCGKVLKSGRALGGHMTLRSHHGQENTLNLVTNVPKTEVLLNVFNHGPDVDTEFMKPGADISVEDLKSSDLSAAANFKRHQCKVCGKLLRSGLALGGHMRLHYVRKCNVQQGVADCPNSALMEEQMQKLGLDSPIFYRRRPCSHGSKI